MFSALFKFVKDFNENLQKDTAKEEPSRIKSTIIRYIDKINVDIRKIFSEDRGKKEVKQTVIVEKRGEPEVVVEEVKVPKEETQDKKNKKTTPEIEIGDILVGG